MDFSIKVSSGVPLQVPTCVLIRVSKEEKEEALFCSFGLIQQTRTQKTTDFTNITDRFLSGGCALKNVGITDLWLV
jgi:hypothetical protein